MDVRSIDHVNLCVPEDGVEAALGFYRDRLGFGVEGVEAYREGDQPFFDVRLAPAHVIHLWPTDEFEPPSGRGFNHVALVVESDIGAVKDRLSAADVPVESELDSPLGATGRAPAVYVRDPFGYRVELKEPAD
jgi:catechol 2,3-dioxygenase-like lactoylglutathione lyase family enzyme